jgi:hypothetical protein
MRTLRFAALAVLFAGVLSIALPREERGHDRGPAEHRPRAILYQDADFQGGFIVVDADRPVADLSVMQFSNGVGANDRVSSIRLEGGAEVRVFRDAYFRGGSLPVTRDIRDLRRIGGRWNDSISSARIDGHGPGRDH